MDLVFSRFEDRKVWWGGPLSNTIKWMLQAAGVTDRADRAELDFVVAAFERWDDLVTYERLMYVAGDVWVSARKPALP